MEISSENILMKDWMKGEIGMTEKIVVRRKGWKMRRRMGEEKEDGKSDGRKFAARAFWAKQRLVCC